MSSTDQAESMSTEEIVSEMQSLTDIEADLTETALAVAAPEPQSAQANASEANEALLENAEQVESVIEDAIPPGPPVEETSALETPSIQSLQTAPASEADAVPSEDMVMDFSTDLSDIIPVESSDATEPISTLPTSEAADASAEALAVVSADINEPILPDRAVAAPQPEEVQPIPIPQPVIPIPAIPAYLMPAEAFEEASNPSTPRAIPAQSANQSTASTSKLSTPLPEGLSHSSPSCLANPHLVKAYQEGMS